MLPVRVRSPALSATPRHTPRGCVVPRSCRRLRRRPWAPPTPCLRPSVASPVARCLVPTPGGNPEAHPSGLRRSAVTKQPRRCASTGVLRRWSRRNAPYGRFAQQLKGFGGDVPLFDFRIATSGRAGPNWVRGGHQMQLRGVMSVSQFGRFHAPGRGEPMVRGRWSQLCGDGQERVRCIDADSIGCA